MKKFFKRFSVAIIAVMLLCSSFVFAGCGGNEPKFDDYFAIYNVEAETVVSSAPYLAPTDPDHPTDRVYIEVLKPVKITRIRLQELKISILSMTATICGLQKLMLREIM